MRKQINKIICIGLCCASVSAGAQNVLMRELMPISSDSLGTIPLQNNDLWIRSDEKTVTDLIKQLSQKSLTEQQWDLFRFLLMADTGSKIWRSDTAESFLKIRSDALFQIGAFQDIVQLIDKIPPRDLSEALKQKQFEALLFSGDTQRACTLLNENDWGIYTDQMRLSCFIVQNEMDKGRLSYDLYTEQYGAADENFTRIADVVFLNQKNTLKNPLVTPQTYFLLQKAGWKFEKVPMWMTGEKQTGQVGSSPAKEELYQQFLTSSDRAGEHMLLGLLLLTESSFLSEYIWDDLMQTKARYRMMPSMVKELE